MSFCITDKRRFCFCYVSLVAVVLAHFTSHYRAAYDETGITTSTASNEQ